MSKLCAEAPVNCKLLKTERKEGETGTLQSRSMPPKPPETSVDSSLSPVWPRRGAVDL